MRKEATARQAQGLNPAPPDPHYCGIRVAGEEAPIPDPFISFLWFLRTCVTQVCVGGQGGPLECPQLPNNPPPLAWLDYMDVSPGQVPVIGWPRS